MNKTDVRHVRMCELAALGKSLAQLSAWYRLPPEDVRDGIKKGRKILDARRQALVDHVTANNSLLQALKRKGRL